MDKLCLGRPSQETQLFGPPVLDLLLQLVVGRPLAQLPGHLLAACREAIDPEGSLVPSGEVGRFGGPSGALEGQWTRMVVEVERVRRPKDGLEGGTTVLPLLGLPSPATIFSARGRLLHGLHVFTHITPEVVSPLLSHTTPSWKAQVAAMADLSMKAVFGMDLQGSSARGKTSLGHFTATFVGK